ncbi:hypothetical protein GQ56_0111465 [Burkholderia paludis]|uniref:aromatic-ring hydroxylase C-terminal domain-containing protein n=1 Tax=Burkholderia paludis TaxID=1506587 RepID=UPI0004DB5ABC|nr:hypothetical protein [Burkholderia paludis]KFG97172.1 hypothetical protein GQ56_0111465 [Burkholderia paludis]
MCGVSVAYARCGHPLVGRSAPDFALADGTRLGERPRHGKGVLPDFDAGRPLQALASRRRDRVAYVASDAQDRLGLRAVLVRPDGFVAWGGEDGANLDDAARAATRWSGAPCAGN